MNNTNDLVIETHGLSKAYKNVQALKSLDLKVAQHSIFGFLGPNGAGKTTTIKLLLGLARSDRRKWIHLWVRYSAPKCGDPPARGVPGPGSPLLRKHDRPRYIALHPGLLFQRA